LRSPSFGAAYGRDGWHSWWSGYGEWTTLGESRPVWSSRSRSRPALCSAPSSPTGSL